jgi:hypothetical protein
MYTLIVLIRRKGGRRGRACAHLSQTPLPPLSPTDGDSSNHHHHHHNNNPNKIHKKKSSKVLFSAEGGRTRA